MPKPKRGDKKKLSHKAEPPAASSWTSWPPQSHQRATARKAEHELPPLAQLTEAEIEAGMTRGHGVTRAQLEAWGLSWPPPKGWKRRLLTSE